MEDSIKRLKEINKDNAQRALVNAQHDENQIANIRLQETVVKSFEYLIGYLEDRVSKTVIVNQLREIGTPDALEVVKAVDNLHNTLKTHENTDLSEITGVMKSLLEETKKIPKDKVEIPKEQKIDYSKQFDSLTKAIQAVETEIKAQKLHVEAPVVNVPETQVNVEAPDLKPLEKGYKEVVKAVKANALDKEGDAIKTHSVNGLVTEKYDEYRMVYDTFVSEENPKLEGIKYYYKGKLVCTLKYKYDQHGNLVSGKRVK